MKIKIPRISGKGIQEFNGIPQAPGQAENSVFNYEIEGDYYVLTNYVEIAISTVINFTMGYNYDYSKFNENEGNSFYEGQILENQTELSISGQVKLSNKLITIFANPLTMKIKYSENQFKDLRKVTENGLEFGNEDYVGEMLFESSIDPYELVQHITTYETPKGKIVPNLGAEDEIFEESSKKVSVITVGKNTDHKYHRV